jgi:hypothetical protein
MDNATRREIEKACQNTLRDAGISGPPVTVDVLLKHLELYRDFYNLQDPTFLDRTKHKLLVNGRKLVQIMKKICLQAVLFPDEGRIVVDSSLPQLKQEWPSFHEMGHRILVWHQPYFYGDTAQTLDPDWQERLEEEANHAASTLMFCGQKFTTEARDTKPEWASVAELKARYRKNYPTTLRRYVQFGPDCPMAMLVSTPSWMDTPEDQTTRCRHFVPSQQFITKFGNVGAEHLRQHVDRQAQRRRGGIVADFTLGLRDDRGDLHEFRAESFFNTIYLQTIFVHLKSVDTNGRIIVPAAMA